MIEKVPMIPQHKLRPRAIYFDDKHEQFFVFVDYLVPDNAKEEIAPKLMNEYLKDGDNLHEGAYTTLWDLKKVRYFPGSDSHHDDAQRFYQPWLRNFIFGDFRMFGSSLGEMTEWD